ncbi:MAG: HEAT repeat domain-containing protein [Phycisphaerales bacterium]|nr:MAG: HEAT repeat domain-containing protein [Phycisphaerales bacterium]
MNDSNVEALVLEYLSSPLTAEREEVLRSLLTEHGYAIEELDELRETYAHLDEIRVPPASEAMTEGFYRLLEEHKHQARAGQRRFATLMAWLRNRWDHRFVARVACGLGLLCAGWWLGVRSAPHGQYERRLDNVTAEIREIKGMMAYAMLSQPSSSDRIQTINHIRTCGALDERAIALLLNKLQHDPNVNVRLVALETLAEQTDRATVRQGLLRALSQQESPLVQLALTDVLVSLGRRAAASQLRELLARPDLNDTVRARIASGLETLM